jgi:hypothetical protein
VIGSGVGLLACAVGGLVWLGLLAWLALALLGGRTRDGLGRARSLLHRRLATGEIDIDEYYERESALRHATVPRRGWLRR